MGLKRNYVKDRRIALFRGMRIQRDTTLLTLSGAAAATIGTKIVKPYGNTIINSTGTGGPHKVGLPAPGMNAIGVEKRFTVNMNASSVDIAIINAVNATKFWGSTCNAITFSTGPKQALTIELIAVSSAQWSIMTPAGSTAAASKKNVYTISNVTS